MSLTIPVSCVSDAFSFYRIVFFLIFLYLLSSYKSDSLHDEYDDDGSDSVSPGTYSFEKNLCVLTNSVGSVSGLGAGIFVPTGVKSKGGQLIKKNWRSNSLFSFQILNSVL